MEKGVSKEKLMITETIKERERIIKLLKEWGYWRGIGTSLLLGVFIDKAIKSEDEEYIEHIERRNHFYRRAFSSISDDGDTGYEARHVSRIDDLTTDLWGGAGPDCRTKPVRAGAKP